MAELLDLDHAEMEELNEFVKEREEFLAWTNQTELAAVTVELLDAINQRLGAGLQVGLVRKPGKPGKTKPVPRPPWMKKAAKVLSPREFFNKMMSRQ